MADQVQWRGGSRENSDGFTGAPREVTVDTTDWVLRVHDGIKPGGHKMMKVNNCLVVETADKCNPDDPTCKVSVNGDLEVHGNTILDDTVIDGNLVVNGNFVQSGITIAVDSSEVSLVNPGVINPNAGLGCQIIPPSANLKTQEDANQYINTCLLALENRVCDFTTGTLDEVIELKDDVTKLWLAVNSLENRTDALEARVLAVEASITQILITITSIEQEVEKNQDSIKDHEGRIAALEAFMATVNSDITNLETELKILIATLNDKVDDLVLDNLVDCATENAMPGQVLRYQSQQWTNVNAPWVNPDVYIPSLTVLF